MCNQPANSDPTIISATEVSIFKSSSLTTALLHLSITGKVLGFMAVNTTAFIATNDSLLTYSITSTQLLSNVSLSLPPYNYYDSIFFQMIISETSNYLLVGRITLQRYSIASLTSNQQQTPLAIDNYSFIPNALNHNVQKASTAASLFVAANQQMNVIITCS